MHSKWKRGKVGGGQENSGSSKSRRVFFSILNKPRGSNAPGVLGLGPVPAPAPFWLRSFWDGCLDGCQTTSTSSSAWRLIFSQFPSLSSAPLVRVHILFVLLHVFSAAFASVADAWRRCLDLLMFPLDAAATAAAVVATCSFRWSRKTHPLNYVASISDQFRHPLGIWL